MNIYTHANTYIYIYICTRLCVRACVCVLMPLLITCRCHSRLMRRCFQGR